MVEVYVPTSEAKALAAAADRFLSDQWGGDSVRAMLDEPSQSVPLAGAVEDMGWTSLTVEDEMGGGGADVATACLLLERLGRQLAPPAVAPALLAARVLADLTDPDVRKGLLERHVAGEQIAVVATDRVGSPVEDHVPLGTRESLDFGALWAPVTDRTTHLLVPFGDAGALAVIPVDADGLTLTPLRRLDGTPMSRVDGSGVAAASVLPWAPSFPSGLFGALLAAAELVGVTETLLEQTCEYARTRQQFGQPIGTFQAVSHRLADIAVDLEIGRSLVAGAAHALDAGDDDAASLSSAAKAWMSDAGVRAAEVAVQLHGGIGFTWECDVHLYLRRVRVQAASFGTARHHRALLSAALGHWAASYGEGGDSGN